MSSVLSTSSTFATFTSSARTYLFVTMILTFSTGGFFADDSGSVRSFETVMICPSVEKLCTRYTTMTVIRSTSEVNWGLNPFRFLLPRGFLARLRFDFETGKLIGYRSIRIFLILCQGLCPQTALSQTPGGL